MILALCAGFFFLRSDAFLNWVETRLASELQSRIKDDYTADIGDIKGSIFGNVTISGVKISKEDEPVISTRRVVLKYNLLGLLTRKFEVKELRVDEPEIHARHDSELWVAEQETHARHDSERTLNLSNIFRKSPANENTSQFSFGIEKILLGQGTIDYVDTQRNLDIRIDGIEIGVSGSLDTWNHNGWWRVKDGSLTLNGATTKIRNFEGNFLFSATDSTLDKLLLKFGNSSLKINGDFAQGETGTPWEITLDLLQLDLADVGQFFGEGTEIEGIVTGNLTANGNPDSGLSGALSLATQTFSLTQAENDRQIALTDLKIDAGFTSEPTLTFTLKTFSAQIADGTLIGRGSIGLQNGLEDNVIKQLQQLTAQPLVYDGEWDVTDAQLIPLLSMFVQLPDFLVDSTGYLSGNATFNGNSRDLSILNLNSKIEITETVLNTVALADSTLSCTVDAGELKADGNFDETEINITGPFPLAEQDSLDIHIADINFDDLMKIVNSADLGGTGEYTAKLSSDGTLAGSIKIPNASFNNIPIGVLVGNLDYEEGQVFIENGPAHEKHEKRPRDSVSEPNHNYGCCRCRRRFPSGI